MADLPTYHGWQREEHSAETSSGVLHYNLEHRSASHRAAAAWAARSPWSGETLLVVETADRLLRR